VGRALATGLLLALCAVAGAVCLLPAGDTRAAVVPPMRATAPAAEALLRAPECAADRSSDRSRVVASEVAEPAVPRTCPDLGQLVAGQARHLRERTRSLERDWVADCARGAGDLDAHCARELLQLGAEPSRDALERLAALSLAAADASLAQELALDAGTLAWLWGQVAAAAPPGDLLARDAAHVAALCLAWLGGPQERGRLVEALDDDARAEAAIFGLTHARNADTALPFVAALESGRAAGPRAMLVVVRRGGELGFPLAPQEQERATAAVERWWLDQVAGSDRLALGSVTLGLLDADAATSAWRARLDARGFEPGTARWSVPALLHGSDSARLEALLGDLGAPARLEVALAALERMDMHPDTADPALRAACVAVLTQTLLEAESPQARLQAVRALARSQAWSTSERVALESAVVDPDERVRRVARHALDAAPGG